MLIILFIISFVFISNRLKKTPSALESNSVPTKNPQSNNSDENSDSNFPNGDIPIGQFIIKLDSNASQEMLQFNTDGSRVVNINETQGDSVASRSIAQLTSELKELNIQEIEQFPFQIGGNVYLRVRLPKNSVNGDTTINAISSVSGVEYVEQDSLVYPQSISDPYYVDNDPPAAERSLNKDNGGWDPEYQYQYGLKNIQFSEEIIADLSKSEVIVAVIDTGLDNTHPELKSRVWSNKAETAPDAVTGEDDDKNGYIDDTWGWNAINYTLDNNFQPIPIPPDNNPFDKHEELLMPGRGAGGHGTAIAGIIAAEADGKGMVGVNPYAKIMPLRICSVSRMQFCTFSALTEMVMYATDNGARVINLSVVGDYSKTMHDAIKYAYDKGVVIVSAVQDIDPDVSLLTVEQYHYPGALDEVIAVTAVDYQDILLESHTWTDIHVAAPGEDILTARAVKTHPYCYSDNICPPGVSTDEYILGDNYMYSTGSSMAAPYVSGLASLIIAKNPSLTSKQVMNIISNGTDDLDERHYGHASIGFDETTGFGRINVKKTLEKMDDSEPSRKMTASRKLPWNITTQIACSHGGNPWTPLEKPVSLYHESRTSELWDRKVVGPFHSRFQDITVDQSQATSYLLFLSKHDYNQDQNNSENTTGQLCPLIPKTRYKYMRLEDVEGALKNSKCSDQSITAWGDDSFAVNWSRDLPAREYTLQYVPLSDSGMCEHTWNVQTKLVCENGSEPKTANTQLIHMVWPDSTDNRYNWEKSPLDSQPTKSIQISSHSGYKNIYIGLRRENGILLQPFGQPEYPGIKYGTVPNSPDQPIVYWAGANLLQHGSPITVSFKAPNEWCNNSPFPTVYPTGSNTDISLEELDAQLPQQADIESIRVANNTDLNDDGITNAIDIFIVIENLSNQTLQEDSNSNASSHNGDVNGDNVVNALDLSAVITAYGS